MSVGSKAVASVLDVIFGDTFIASIYNSSRFFDMIFDLIILACYIYLFKHFCSFLTNMLTSMLNFDGQGFSRSTSDAEYGNSKATGVGFFQSGNFMDQITSATNYKAIESANRGFVKRTSGFKNLDKYTGLSNFTMFDGNRFSLKKAFDTGFGVIKTTSSSIYNGITRKSQENFKEFVKLRNQVKEDKMSTRPDSIEGLNLITKNKDIQYLLKQINNDKISQDERNAYQKRLELVVNQNFVNIAQRNIHGIGDLADGNITKAYRNAIEDLYRRGLMDETMKKNALLEEKRQIRYFSPRTHVDASEYEFTSFEKNRNGNSRIISELAKLSRDGYFDMSTIGAGSLDLQKLINGEISDEDYKTIQNYVKAQGLRGTNKAIFKNISENIQLIKGTDFSKEELDFLEKISKGKNLEEIRSLMTDAMYEKIMKKEQEAMEKEKKEAREKERIKESRKERREREKRIREEIGEIKTDSESVSEELTALKDSVKNDLNEDAAELLKDKEITLCDTDLTYDGHVVIGYTDDNIVLYITDSGEIGAATDVPGLTPDREEILHISAAVEPGKETEETNILTEDQQTVDYSKAIMRATNIKKKILEYQIAALEDSDSKLDKRLRVDGEEMIKQLEEKSEKLKKRIKTIEDKYKKEEK